MSNKITGDEPFYHLASEEPFYPLASEELSDRHEQYPDMLFAGISIKQEALLRFMCAITEGMCAAGKSNLWTPTEVAYKAETLTNAYIEQLNK
jgi:hypothetical protein